MKTVQLTLIALSILVTAGCGTTNKQTSTNYEKSKTKSDGVGSGVEKKRVLIYNATITLKVKQADSAEKSLKSIADKYGGYVVRSSKHHVKLRVVSESLKVAIKEIEQLGKVKSKVIKGEDVTASYKDYKIRLENKLRARKKYLSLLDTAEDVEAALKVEKELERVNEEIDLLKGRINRIEHLADYSTIDVTIKERKILGPLGLVFVGLYEAVKFLFVIKS